VSRRIICGEEVGLYTDFSSSLLPKSSLDKSLLSRDSFLTKDGWCGCFRRPRPRSPRCSSENYARNTMLNTPWIAMEYMDAGYLGERCGAIERPQTLWTAIAVTKGVHHAHRKGVAHRHLPTWRRLLRTVHGHPSLAKERTARQRLGLHKIRFTGCRDLFRRLSSSHSHSPIH